MNRLVRAQPPRRLPAQDAFAPDPIAAPASTARRLTSRGRTGEVHFFLQRVNGGLYVEREEAPARGIHTVQAIVFDTAEQFHRWCDGDATRFEHPVLHAGLRRDGDDLLGLVPH